MTGSPHNCPLMLCWCKCHELIGSDFHILEKDWYRFGKSAAGAMRIAEPRFAAVVRTRRMAIHQVHQSLRVLAWVLSKVGVTLHTPKNQSNCRVCDSWRCNAERNSDVLVIRRRELRFGMSSSSWTNAFEGTPEAARAS